MAVKDEVARKNQAMDEMLAELHGTQAFREFVISHHPGANIPKVNQCVLVLHSHIPFQRQTMCVYDYGGTL